MTVQQSRLFEPLQIGPIKLSSRIVMGPLGSYASDKSCVISSTAIDYYGQRACVPGTFIIAEATFPSAQAGGTSESRAGIYTPEQIAAWKAVVTRIHEAGSFAFLQLWALGRSAEPEVKARDGSGDVVSSSALPMEGGAVPRALTEEEIHSYIRDHATAAKAAVEEAGFDGVEIHGGNASLIDQFTQDVVNKRTDAWGGSVENRSRFGLEITRAVCDAIGSDRVGYRISPWSTYQSMGMEKDATIAQFSHLLEGLKGLKIAYVHLVESRIAGRVDVAAGQPLDFFFDVWGKTAPVVLAGGFNPDSAKMALDEQYKDKDVAIAFGRAFVTNPDLVQRLKDGVELREG